MLKNEGNNFADYSLQVNGDLWTFFGNLVSFTGKLSQRIRFLYLPWQHCPATFNSSWKIFVWLCFFCYTTIFPSRKILNKFLIFTARLGFLLLFALQVKIMRPLIFSFPQCMAHQNSSFYWVELNIILFFLISENFNFSAHCALYFYEGSK